MSAVCMLRNSEAVGLEALPRLAPREFLGQLVAALEGDQSLCAYYALPLSGTGFEVRAVLGDRLQAQLRVLSSRTDDGRWKSIAARCPQAHLFEREMHESWGLQMEGHPWLKPVRFTSRSAPAEPGGAVLPAVTDFFALQGEQIHEVAVGPVHAGIIEPGHFRFQCHGETVFHLEIALGFQHRGIEARLIGGPDVRTLHYLQTAAGDSTVGHATAYCHAVEALMGITVSPRAQALRGIALELERLANHTGDLGALAGDVGFLPTMSYCGRLRGDFLNMTALICGSRFGRNLVCPGGVAFDIDGERTGQLLKRLEATMADVRNAVELLWETPSVMARFEGTGTLTQRAARELGLVGPAARASGATCDVRSDFPDGIYQFAYVPLSTLDSGDVFARAYVRWLEIQRAAAFVQEQLQALPGGPVLTAPAGLRPDKVVMSLVEGWRGEICHCVQTGPDGHISSYKIVDPSFHNWSGLALALRNQQISDFPLCNKSFNLSYCGHDL